MTKDMKNASRIIEASGNSFHAKVLRFFEAAGWAVQISPFYSDSTSGKPREIDLLAEKAFPVITDIWGKRIGALRLRLYIECKFIKQDTVFWFHKQDVAATLDLIERRTALRRTNSFMKDHHYLLPDDGRVAKLFSGPKTNAIEGEQFYRALSQVLSATVVLRRAKSILPDADTPADNPTVHYPVIVCSSFDSFYRTDIAENDEPRSLDENFLLEVNYAYPNTAGASISEYFLLDVLDFGKLEEYLEVLDKEIAGMAVMLSEN
ncbi:MAG TPA: hypothetical protein VMR74_08565 [Gammaproteobacteria bacterium]|nr:hypothetical protein [Gammaproteobacteria bacterium]